MNKLSARSTALLFLVPLLLFLSGQADDQNSKIGEINRGLRSDDAEEIGSAVSAIRALTREGQLPSSVLGAWLPALEKKGRFSDLANISLELLPLMPDAASSQKLLKFRAKSLLATGDATSALVAAKMFYNVCAVADAQDAIDLVCECLGKIDSAGGDLAYRFRVEQSEGSARERTVVSGGGAGAEPMLRRIRIDNAEIGAAAALWQAKNEKAGDRLKYGNLLLLEDHCEEALAVFRQLYDEPHLEREHALAAEAIARGLRARDGVLLASNRWLQGIEEARVTASAQKTHGGSPASTRPFSASLPAGTFRPPRFDPRDIALMADRADVRLAAWYGEWQSRRASRLPISSQTVRGLQQALSQSPLTSREMLDWAHAFHFVSGDIELAAMVYDAASRRIESEFGAEAANSREVIETEWAIFYHLQDFKHVLWPMIENHHPQFAETLYRIYSNFVSHVPPDDAELLKAARRPAVGMAECLYTMGRLNEALQALETTHGSQTTPSDKIAWSWAYSLVLMGLQRSDDAVPYLREVTKDENFEYASAAKALLAQLTGEVGGARATTRKVEIDAKLP